MSRSSSDPLQQDPHGHNSFSRSIRGFTSWTCGSRSLPPRRGMRCASAKAFQILTPSQLRSTQEYLLDLWKKLCTLKDCPAKGRLKADEGTAGLPLPLPRLPSPAFCGVPGSPFSDPRGSSEVRVFRLARRVNASWEAKTSPSTLLSATAACRRPPRRRQTSRIVGSCVPAPLCPCSLQAHNSLAS